MKVLNFDFTGEGEILLIDKPYQWTSFDVVAKVRNALKIKKVGHAGTLDPLATGLLIVCVGKKTKQIESLQGMEKEYTGEIVLGKTTASYDLEHPAENPKPYSHIALEEVKKAAGVLTGDILQSPPAYSAIKVDGRRAYKNARQGDVKPLEKRPVSVYEFEITEFDLPKICFKIRCSKGTYIRSLAHDLGQSLGCGAYLRALKRTQIGEMDLKNAWQLPRLIEELKIYREQNAAKSED